MGYYTRFNMEVQDIDNVGYNAFEIAKYMLDKYHEKSSFYPFENQLKHFIDDVDNQIGEAYGLCLDDDEDAKWYKHTDEMTELSKEFPNVLFKLHGEGEDSGDIWDAYFMNGKMQYCPARIMCPPFDRNKLR